MSLTITPAEIVAKAEASGAPGLLAKAARWDRVPLGQVATVVNGAAFPSAGFNLDGRGMPLIRIRDVGAKSSATWFEGPWEQKHLVEHGDLLIGMDGDFRVAPWAGDDALLNQRVCRIDVDESLYLKRFLALVLQGYLDAIWAETSSVTVKHLSSRSIANIPLPRPSLGEQRLIVDVLEDHLSRLDAAERFLERGHSSAKALVRAALQSGLRGKLVTDDLSEGSGVDLLGEAPTFTPQADERVWPVPETWAWVRIGDVFEVNVGATPSRAIAAHWSGDLPWVSSGEVAFGRISSTREHITREAAGNPARRIHPPGTVMLAMIGEGKTRGQAAILDIEAAHNQNCASIRASATKVLPEYIYGYLEERYLETRRRGSGGQQPALNKAAIQRFPVPIAPLGTQRRLVAAWTEARDAANRLENGMSAANLRRSTLRRALLEAAFSGRLTENASDASEAEEMIDA